MEKYLSKQIPHISLEASVTVNLISPLPFDNGHDFTGQMVSIDSAAAHAQDAHENIPKLGDHHTTSQHRYQNES